MTDHTNPVCRACTQSRITIRGRWCVPLSRLVEYSPEPPCTTAAPPSPKDT